MNNLLQRIKNADKPDLLPVEVPEWDGITVYVKQLTVGERDLFEKAAFQANKEGEGIVDNTRSRFLALVLCDKDGHNLVEPENFKELSGLSSRPMERLFDVASKHNYLSDTDMEELAKK
tara:strand:- start:321 stop:677 length:357 start_codon:yes stop_codon:yes gene_type:complete